MRHLKLFEAYFDNKKFGMSAFAHDLTAYYEKYNQQVLARWGSEDKDAVVAAEWEYKNRWSWEGKEGALLSFLMDCAENGRVIKGRFGKLEKERTNYQRACFYNSLAYVRQFQKSQPGLELAYGYVVPQKTFSDIEGMSKVEVKDYHRVLIEVTQHAFLVKDGMIIDPTYAEEVEPEDHYFYDICPKSDWQNFRFKDNDKNFDAEDFADYIDMQTKNCQEIKYEMLRKAYLK